MVRGGQQRGADQRDQSAGQDGGELPAHGHAGEAVLRAEEFRQQRALRAEHGLNAEGDAHHHDNPDQRDIAQRHQVERRQRDERLEQRTVAVDRHPAEPVGQRTERDHHDGREARGDEQADRTDELVAGKNAVLGRQERDEQGGVDRGIAVFAHPQADADQHVLLRVLPQLADGVLDHILVLFQFLEDRAFPSAGAG